MDFKNTHYFLLSVLILLSTNIFADNHFHKIKFESLTGKNINFSSYKGEVILIVNTASRCGYTPQLKGLQNLYTKYKNQGFKVLGFPSNDFNQEDMNGKKLADHCLLNYGVKFPMFSTSSVTGKNKNIVYKTLSPKTDVNWNFEKILVSKNGTLLSRYPSQTAPTDKKLIQDIEKALGKPNNKQ